MIALWSRRWFLVLTVGLLFLSVLFIMIAGGRPAFYAPARGEAAVAPHREQAARRLVTQLSAVHGGLGRPGRWEAAIADEEVNAWLDLDLPRNHPGLLPGLVHRPQVAFAPKRIQAAARIGYGLASVVAWVDMEVVLRDVNQLQLALLDGRIGRLPLPRGIVLNAVARRLEPLGVVSDLRRIDNRPVLVVYIPSGGSASDRGSASGGSASDRGHGMHCRLEGLRIDPGELVIEGVTRREQP